MKKRVLLYFILVITFFFFNFYFRPIKGNPLVTSEYKKSNNYINELYMSDEYFKKKVLSESDYYIYDEIINNSLNNKGNVSIECKNDCSNAFSNALTAVSLDHPELISFFGVRSATYEDNSIHYYNLENLGSIRSYLGAKRIAREMENIRHDTANMNDKEKIIYVYNYVASHNYDRMFMGIGSNQSAYSFFTKKTSVCAGFAKTSQIIFQNIGISSYLVVSSEHMWNYVEYEGKYYIFDATVGASFTDKTLPIYYDGLGKTTTDEEKGYFHEYYPKIETKKTLRELFEL